MCRERNAGGGRRISYANAMSTLAVVLALGGGTAIAAALLAPNSVGTATVRDGSLRGVDLADGHGVGGVDIADGSLTGQDLADGSLSGADVADGSLAASDLAPGVVGLDQLATGGVGKGAVAPGALESSHVLDGSLRGADLGTDTVTGAQVAESSLDSSVPNARKLAGFDSNAFLAFGLAQRESLQEKGEQVGLNSFRVTMACQAGEKLLSGGPANLNAGSVVFENAPVNGAWAVGVTLPAGTIDAFSVVVLCARAHQ